MSKFEKPVNTPVRRKIGQQSATEPAYFRVPGLPGTLLAMSLAILIAGCGEPVPVQPPRPTVIVVTSEGPFYETFDEAGDWLLGDSERSSGRIEDGVYVLNVKEPSMVAWSNQSRAFGDGTYSAEVALQYGPEASAFGLLLLGSSDLKSFVYVMITADGRYDIGTCENACRRQKSLVDGFTLAYAIVSGLGSVNHLDVTLNDGSLLLAVNGTPVGQVSGLRYTEGLVGLIGESSPYGGFAATFDNVHVEASP